MRSINISGFTRIFILLEHLVLTLGVGHHHHTRHSLLTDKAALLAFKRTIVFDPNLTLANWVDTVNVCNFTGVTCDNNHHRVARLNLSKSELYGPLSPCISNLTGLRVLSLVENHFYGRIPPELSYLYHLRHLLLDTNNLEGPIPDTLSALANLTVVTLNQNYLTSEIPPSFFSNCTLLRNVDLSNNLLQGKIPEEIGNCLNLWNLNLYGNQFTGKLPASLMNNTSLYNLDVQDNYLTGELPSQIVEKLVNLTYLYLSYNKMTSHDRNTNLNPFFTSLKNCTALEEIELTGMGIGGRLPSSIGQPKLTHLFLPENNIVGSIPAEIRNVSFLRELNLSHNHLSGTILEEISQLSHLQQLSLSYNWFNSVIPATLGQLPHLGVLDLSNNELSGEIPASLGNLVHLSSLFLNNNQLSGKIPPAMAHCIDLYRLDLSYNNLTGSIPPELSGIREIRIFLNLSHNHLDGPFPIEFSKLENVQEIDVSFNHLNGSIFPQISSCTALRLLNLAHNFLQGQLPDSLGDLMSLESFDASENHLSGIIPVSLNKAPRLTFLNLSSNNFEGMIPSGGIFNLTTNMSFLGNPHLCGVIPGIPICSLRRHWLHSRTFLIIFVIVIFVSGFLTTICCVIGFRHIKLVISSNKIEAVKKPSTPEILNFPRITYRELSEATDGFDEQRLIGTGSYGRVYKGVLPDGMAIAVKVLQLQSDFKALVLPYMANGSLDSRLYPHSTSGLSSGSSDLSLIQRVNICSDIAEGMAYLHHHSPVRVIHCDLKPSNVLLNDDMTALVSDFGIARLVMTAGVGNAGLVDNMGNSTANMLYGSVGYIAPGTSFLRFSNFTFLISAIIFL